MRKKISFFLMLCGLLLAATATPISQSRAQGVPPQMILTWQAGTYVPADYSGKVMPASDSAVTVGLDVVSQGKRIDLSPLKVYWYINDKFYQGSNGLARISFTAPHFIGKTSVTVKALLPDYPSGPAKTITIPIVVPEAVIQSSAPSVSVAAAPFALQAYPYFFNVTDPSRLSFVWTMNGANVSNQNPFTVTREMADRGAARIELNVKNPLRIIEQITEDLTILQQ